MFFCVGTQDKKVLYESNLDQAIPNRSLSALRILIINQNLNIFPSSEVSEILAAMAALQPLVGDFRLFTLFLLSAMFSIKESAGCEAMAEMRKQYDDLLMAKFSGIWSARTARQKIQESLEAATKLGSYAKKLTLVDISEEKPRTPTVPASPVITIS